MEKPSVVLLPTLLGAVLLTVACTPKTSVEDQREHLNRNLRFHSLLSI